MFQKGSPKENHPIEFKIPNCDENICTFKRSEAVNFQFTFLPSSGYNKMFAQVFKYEIDEKS